MKRVESENVARMIEFGCCANAGVAFFVIELLDGMTLHDIIVSRGPLPVQEACRVGLDVLSGLRDIHEAGLIHRDIKPQNIIRVPSKDDGREWTYKIIDFGSAVAALGPERFALPSFGGPYGSTSSSESQLEAIFAMIDLDGKGLIGSEEVLRMFHSLDIQVSPQHIDGFLVRHDADGDGKISGDEFAAMFTELATLPYSSHALKDEQAHHLKEVFDSLDINRDGHLSLSEIEGAFVQLNRQPSRQQLTWLMTKYDGNSDGQISEDEFRLMYGELVALQDSMNMQGTHGYMPPEQYNDMILSPASDVWSLGATLFRLVSGQLPFAVTGGTWGKGIIGDMNMQAPKLSHVVFGVPPVFEKIIERSLRKDSSERFRNAHDMREEMHQVYSQLTKA